MTPRALGRADQNLLGFLPTESEVVTADFDFDGVPERRETDQLDFGPHQDTHLHEAWFIGGGHLDFGDTGPSTDRQGAKRLKSLVHGQTANR